MICGVCGVTVATMEHRFHEGRFENPKRMWIIEAPLYFKSNEDYTQCLIGFCSAEHSVEYMRAEQHAESIS